jgi:hypothetical protein
MTLLGTFCGILVCASGHTFTYVDDQDPRQAADVAALVARHVPTVAGISMARPWQRFPGAINAIEWYPYSNYCAWANPFPPPAQAYILQRRFTWKGSRTGATWRQQRQLFRRAMKHHPYLIIFYDAQQG